MNKEENCRFNILNKTTVKTVKCSEISWFKCSSLAVYKKTNAQIQRGEQSCPVNCVCNNLLETKGHVHGVTLRRKEPKKICCRVQISCFWNKNRRDWHINQRHCGIRLIPGSLSLFNELNQWIKCSGGFFVFDPELAGSSARRHGDQRCEETCECGSDSLETLAASQLSPAVCFSHSFCLTQRVFWKST